MKIAFHTLGCKVNQYESEAMARMFRARGHEIVGEREFADVYVINTCTVTAVADKKSRQYIRRMKKVNPDSLVAVTGCYAQIEPDAVAGVEGVDIVTGTNEKATLPDLVEEMLHAKAGPARSVPAVEQTETDSQGADADPVVRVRDWQDLDTYEDMGIVTSAEDRTRAYIKIQEGCNRFCAYCVIPYARGKVRSRNLDEIVAEAKQLIDAGYKELVLTGINTALYGMDAADVPAAGRGEEAAEAAPVADMGEEAAPAADVPAAGRGEEAVEAAQAADVGEEAAQAADDSRQPYGVERVIAALDALDGDFRIRLSSLEPAVVNADYVQRLLKYKKLCHHLHLSAQSGSDRILAAMNRPYDRTQYLQIVETVRRFDPYYGLSTDIIVGFPGEKEKDFEDSCSLTAACDFCKTHVFKYSRRPNTAAAVMKEQVSPQVKNRRSDTLQEAGRQASASFCMKNLGQVRTVLVEEFLPERGMLTGYTDNYIRVYIACPEADAAEMLNTFRQVRLTEVYRDGCTGVVV